MENSNNHILGSLPHEVYLRLLPEMERVELVSGTVLYEAHEPIEHVYFPITGVVSTMARDSGGQSVETGMVGREGMSGFEVLLQVNSTLNDTVVLISGEAVRINNAAILAEFDSGKTFRRLSLQFVHALLLQVYQTALCNRLHSTDQRLARRILTLHDCTAGADITLTHDMLAGILGGNRPSVTISAIKLQNAGAIRYTRGHIRITNSEELQKICCECYEKLKSFQPFPVKR